MVDGRPGSRAQYRLCQFAIGWSVTEGQYGDTDLSHRHIAMVGYWDEDEAGAPWRVGVYVDSGASGEERAVLGRIVTGRSVLDVKGGPLEFSYAGRCGFVASFDYRSD